MPCNFFAESFKPQERKEAKNEWKQTNRAITIFSTWYQTLLFFAVLISVIGGIFALVMYVLKRRALIAAHDPKYFDFIDDGKESETDLDKAQTGVNA